MSTVSKLFYNSIRRFCSRETVRVRFAPSPTGNLHLGGLRTAFYNYLYARKQNGKFILRIEDTDRKRTIPDSSQKIIHDLTWCGLMPDEGPTLGGNFGPYIQSQRQDLYTEFATKLIQKGAAYYCFCSEKRLDLLRKDALKKNLVPKYDNRCRHLTPTDVKFKLSSDIDKCIRFKLIDSQPFADLVYGTFLHEVEDIEGDPVILKKDGWPTYHLANVVDDYSMKISHVIRGVEWLQSTNKHLMIYSALGFTPPKFAHLPLLLNADGSKFSKRQNDLSLEFLRKKGIFSKTLLNFICHSSSGFLIEKTHNSINNFTMEEVIKKFDLRNVGTSSSRLPLDRLEEFNRFEIKRQAYNSQERDRLISAVRELVENTFPLSKGELDLEYEHIKKILLWSIPRISYLKDLIKKDLQFLWVKPCKQQLEEKDIDILMQLKQELHDQPFDAKNLNIFLKKFSQSRNLPFREFMMFARKIISGLQNGPGVAEMLAILGKKTCFERIDRSIGEISCINKTKA